MEVASRCAAVRGWVMVSRPPVAPMVSTRLLPFRPEAMSPAQLAAVSYLARPQAEPNKRRMLSRADVEAAQTPCCGRCSRPERGSRRIERSLYPHE